MPIVMMEPGLERIMVEHSTASWLSEMPAWRVVIVAKLPIPRLIVDPSTSVVPVVMYGEAELAVIVLLPTMIGDGTAAVLG